MKSSGRNRVHGTLCLFCRVGLGAVFIYASIQKLNAPQVLADNIAAYRLLPDALVNIGALVLPLFEFACGFLLVTGIWSRTGLLGVIGMLALFLGALVSVIVRGLSVDCGCFGADTWLGSSPWSAAVRDVVLLGWAVYAYGYYLRQNAEVSIRAPERRDARSASEKSTRTSTV